MGSLWGVEFVFVNILQSRYKFALSKRSFMIISTKKKVRKDTDLNFSLSLVLSSVIVMSISNQACESFL